MKHTIFKVSPKMKKCFSPPGGSKVIFTCNIE